MTNEQLQARRVAAALPARFRFGPFELRRDDRRLLRGGAPLALAPRAFDVLVLLVERAGALVSRDELLAGVWPRAVVEANAVQSQVSALRKCIGARAIETVSGHGYRFALEVTKDVVPAAAARPDTPNNLPHPLTSFVGRETEIAALQQALRRHRLLSLVGAGGCGKSRLALRLASGWLGVYPGGVWLVEFAALADPGLVPNALAAVLGLREESGRALTQTIVSHLSGGPVLLVMDNAEHLRDAIGEFAETVLHQCPEVRMLVTSRESLAVPGESIYRVPSLGAPTPDDELTAERLAGSDAVRLFVERVNLHRPDFELSDANAPAVASICRRLDGMPLAIELAAPVLRAMSIDEMDRRLERSFALLSSGARTALHRQRTLRATIDWSHDLLSDAERRLLHRLAVFAGGWTLETAQAICAGEPLAADTIEGLLLSLADKSLVAADESHGTTRFTMLQAVREYARDRLAEQLDAVQWRRRHLDHFVGLAESSMTRLTTADTALIDAVDAEYDNLRTALAAATEIGCPAKGLRLGAALYRFWWWTGRWGEGLAALLRALEPGGSDDLPVRAAALKSAGIFAGLRGDYGAAHALHEQAIAINRESGDLPALASALIGLGITNYDQGRYDAARANQTEALAIARHIGDPMLVRPALNNLGNVAGELGDCALARACHEESLAIASGLQDRWSVATSLNNLGVIARYEGDVATAAARCEASLAIFRETGEPRSVAMCLGQLGAIACDEGDSRRGRPMLEESLATLSRLGDRLGVIDAIEAIADAVTGDAAADAVRLWGAVGRLRDASGIPSSPVAAARRDARVMRARRETADDAVFEQRWHEGRLMDPQQLVGYALNVVRTAPAAT